MDSAMKIIGALIKMQEQASLIRHGREETLEGIPLAATHCIDWIDRLEQANVTKLANAMGMTRGAISKICKKLQAKELIVSYQQPDNNKEIYFRLTEAGQQVYKGHEKCHNQSRAEKLALLMNYTNDEQAVILRFLTEINLLADNQQVRDMLAGETPEEE